MDFFKKTWVRITAWVVLFLDIVVLFLGGVTQTEVSTGVELAFSAIAIIAGIIAFIAERVKNKK